jgi:hypothetical protein
MSVADFADSLFLGAGAIPVLLLLAGDAGAAILTLVALLCAACLAALADPGAPFRTMSTRNGKRH